jgi:hypothetical protein
LFARWLQLLGPETKASYTHHPCVISPLSVDLAIHRQAFVAQWIEQEPSNLLVAGSIPAEGTKSFVVSYRLGIHGIPKTATVQSTHLRLTTHSIYCVGLFHQIDLCRLNFGCQTKAICYDYGMKTYPGSLFRRITVVTLASLAASVTLTVAPPLETRALASDYGIEYYIAPPFTQGSYVTSGMLSENFDSLSVGACPSSIGVGTVSGARCNVEVSGDYGGAGVEATVSTPTVGGSAQGKYVSTDSRAMTIDFSGDQRYLGLWWSAGSDGNTITFFDGATEVLQLGTAELRTLLGSEPTDGGSDWETTGSLSSVGGSTYPKHHFFGNPRGYSSTDPGTHSSLVRWEPFVYLHIFTSGGLTFDSVVLSGTDGFELDNIVVSTQNQIPDTSLVRIGSVSSSVVPLDCSAVAFWTMAGDGVIKKWSTSGELLRTLSGFPYANDMAVSSDLGSIVLFSAPLELKVFDAETGLLSSGPHTVTGDLEWSGAGAGIISGNRLLVDGFLNSTIFSVNLSTYVSELFANLSDVDDSLPLELRGAEWGIAGDLLQLPDGDILAITKPNEALDGTGLLRISASDPTQIIVVGILQINDEVWGAARAGDDVYVATANGDMLRLGEIPTSASFDTVSTTRVLDDQPVEGYFGAAGSNDSTEGLTGCTSSYTVTSSSGAAATAGTLAKTGPDNLATTGLLVAVAALLATGLGTLARSTRRKLKS